MSYRWRYMTTRFERISTLRFCEWIPWICLWTSIKVQFIDQPIPNKWDPDSKMYHPECITNFSVVDFFFKWWVQVSKQIKVDMGAKSEVLAIKMYNRYWTVLVHFKTTLRRLKIYNKIIILYLSTTWIKLVWDLSLELLTTRVLLLSS